MSRPGDARPDIIEKTVLESLRPRFEKLGYAFVPQPPSSVLPTFMAGYVPDAIATRGSDKVAIEVKGPAGFQTDRLLAVRSRFEDQSDWRLAVVTSGAEPLNSLQIPSPEVDSVRRAVEDVERLVEQGQPAAALVMSFALLEATSKVASDEREPRANRPDAVVQALAIAGLIEGADEMRLRSLIEARNKVVHGDLGIEIAPDDPRFVLATIDKVLAAAFAI